MIAIDKRVQGVFDKKLKDWHLELRLGEPEINQIKRALQEAYELGHADGFADAFYDIEANGYSVEVL